MSPNDHPVFPSSLSITILLAAPAGTAAIIPPSAERPPFRPVPGYALPPVLTTTSTHKSRNVTRRGPRGGDAPYTDNMKRCGSKNKRAAKLKTVSLDYSIRAPVDEELFDGSTEVPTFVDDHAPEEALIKKLDSDGVEARISGIKIDNGWPVPDRRPDM